jgi:hypothetical protein
MIYMVQVEAPSGLEPLHRGFADLSLSHLGTAPLSGQRNRIVVDTASSSKNSINGLLNSDFWLLTPQ